MRIAGVGVCVVFCFECVFTRIGLGWHDTPY